MSKLKVVLLIILAVVLADFAVENTQPSLVIRLFKNELGSLPTFLLAYISLALGFLSGWLAHFFRLRKKRREAAAAESASVS